ncbi:Hypothetical protein DEACI_2192 [Acididesulfobacillus acetoxydans]|uniref:Uncharacterized protein n=1 Tax=Acididesulfobacillus acetoxydans TaxID=1561005 RepID=A0A8S0Y327_9FIRM|nr:Hypothetical protein DEACI_2192 [Acididesulfobacillus acetoxydans]CEJ07012.1 Hypothetical protein DEACI_1466 [Acididesulfobacillus acetoxydans]
MWCKRFTSRFCEIRLLRKGPIPIIASGQNIDHILELSRKGALFVGAGFSWRLVFVGIFSCNKRLYRWLGGKITLAFIIDGYIIIS